MWRSQFIPNICQSEIALLIQLGWVSGWCNNILLNQCYLHWHCPVQVLAPNPVGQLLLQSSPVLRSKKGGSKKLRLWLSPGPAACAGHWVWASHPQQRDCRSLRQPLPGKKDYKRKSELNFHLLSFTQFHLLDQLIPIGIHFHVLDTAMMEMGYFSISPSSRFFQCSQAID